MKLKLQLHSSPRGPLRAAFLRGNAPQHWLGTLQSWGIPLSELEAYAVPQSKSDLRVAGLLLIMRQGHFSAQLDFQEPYRCIGQALLIPQYADVQPQVAEEEWKNLLIYDWHFFHPGIGMVGFHHSDRISLADLLTYPAPLEQDWSLAKPGPPSAPALRQISVLQPKVEDIFAQVQGVGDKDLKELGKNKPSPEDGKDIRSTLLSSLEKLLNQRPNLRDGETQGWLGKMLDRLEMRISQILADLQKQRESEIDRLLKLYQDDPEEALRYSIPLDSPYEGRGIAPPSGLLGRNNDPDFKLGGLNTGGPRDNWNLDAQRQIALRQHYLRLANQKIAEGDFRKAAYIHAHLLGDFHTAANVLEQGKHFYEAAILYRDHLKDKQRAAQCFEKGGLYTEAIDLYLELGENEKAGDLYTLIDRPEEARIQYQGCIEVALGRADYLDAARLYQSKLADDVNAKCTLLNGWQQNQNPIACLQRYFDFYQQVNHESFDLEVQTIYQTQVKPMQHSAFMEVLKEIGKNEQRRAALPRTREIVYTIVSQELAAESLNHLSMLNTFVPNDRLLQADSTRFSVNLQAKKTTKKINNNLESEFPSQQKLLNTYHLDTDKTWLEARIINHNLVVLGKKGQLLYLYCSNLEDKQETFLVGQSIAANSKNQLFAVQNHSNYLGITQMASSNHGFELALAYLGKKINPLNLKSIDSVYAYAPVHSDKIAQLEIHTDDSVSLCYLDAKGKFLESHLCTDVKGKAFVFNYHYPKEPILMEFRKEYFYFVVPEDDDALLYRIHQTGRVEAYSLYRPAIKMAISDEGTTALRLVIHEATRHSTNYRCQFFRVNEPSLVNYKPFKGSKVIDCFLFMGQGLVITNEDQVRLYETTSNDTINQIGAFEVESYITAAFKGPMTNQVGLLTKSGKVLFYEISSLNA